LGSDRLGTWLTSQFWLYPSRSGDARSVTDDEVLELAAVDGFALRPVVTEYHGSAAGGWVRWDDDYRWPAFVEHGQAVN
jgi:hypothetical protein